jgi:hypothetical protein
MSISSSIHYSIRRNGLRKSGNALAVSKLSGKEIPNVLQRVNAGKFQGSMRVSQSP